MASNSNKNLEIYTLLEKTDDVAKKDISAGRLKGFTNINPMWRIKKLTEVFGACGIGWWTEIINQWTEKSDTGEVKAFVEIKFFYKWNGEVSQPIYSVGGSSFVAKEKGGLYTNDECFKMAYTDAIGGACKMLGMSSDIYFSKDESNKYQVYENPSMPDDINEQVEKYRKNRIENKIQVLMTVKGYTREEIDNNLASAPDDATKEQWLEEWIK